jgi:hypothetical protein
MQHKRIRLPSGEVVDAPSTTIRPPPPLPTPKPLVVPPERIEAVACPQTDRQILDAIVSKADHLAEYERKAFTNMRRLLVDGRIHHLQWKQRAWAQRVAARLGFGVEDPGDWHDIDDDPK